MNRPHVVGGIDRNNSEVQTRPDSDPESSTLTPIAKRVLFQDLLVELSECAEGRIVVTGFDSVPAAIPAEQLLASIRERAR